MKYKFKNKKTKLFVTVFVGFLPQAFSATPANYAVNMQDGGLILKESLPIVSSTRSPLDIERTYRSRSLTKGFFGQGWCSDFESSLQFQAAGNVRLENCGLQSVQHFKISTTASSYINTENKDDRILIKLGHYERQKNGQIMALYNFQGQLVETRLQGKIWKIQYNSRKLPARLIAQDTSMDITWHPILSLIEKIETSNNKNFQFRYEGFNLIQVKVKQNSAVESFDYQYDDLDNLVLRKNSKNEVKFHYNKVQDQVKEIQADCKESYFFDKKSSLKMVSYLKKSCPGQLTTTTKFDFEYNLKSRLPAQVNVIDIKNETFERLAKLQTGVE